MATEQQYRDKARKARKQAYTTSNPEKRQRWLEVAKEYERLGEQPRKTPWHIEMVEPKK